MMESSQGAALTTNWQLLCMHGWGSDQRAWNGFRRGCELRKWPLRCFERGYGRFPVAQPDWEGPGRRALLLNSLGMHLVPPQTLAAAEAVVLLASFGRFVPGGAAGRPLALALQRMDERLAAGELPQLFADVRIRGAEPQPVELLPAGVEDGPVQAQGLARLRDDLALLAHCSDLPASFPQTAPVLLVEASDDQIVHPLSREALRQALPKATVFPLNGVGHGLMVPSLPAQVLQWIAELR
jgi:pimeloyl-[acyl-carrier protein] methyl ester esterase